jgi:hypothetical protein
MIPDARTPAHRFAGAALYFFSTIALVAVMTGFFQRPQADEGAAAHIFQLSIAAFGAAFVLFVATRDGKLAPSWRALKISTAVMAAAFVALYYLEHVFYPAHFR